MAAREIVRQVNQQQDTELRTSCERTAMVKLALQSSGLDSLSTDGALYFLAITRGLSLWPTLLKPIGHIALPESGWWTDYRRPMTQRLKVLDKKYLSQPTAQCEIEACYNKIVPTASNVDRQSLRS